MIRVTCDGCEKPIDRDNDRWYGLDVTEPVQPIEFDEDDETQAVLTELRINGDHAHHFCSAECLSAWAFSKELDK